MSSAHGPEFGSGAPLQPRHAEAAATPPAPESLAWTADPYLSGVARTDTPDSGNDVYTEVKTAVTGSFGIVPSNASLEVDTTAPSFEEIPLSTGDEEAALPVGDPEATVEVAPVMPADPTLTAPAAESDADTVTFAPVEIPAVIEDGTQVVAEDMRPEPVTTEEVTAPEPAQPGQPEEEQPTTSVVLGGKIRPAAPSVGRHVLSGTIEPLPEVPQTLTHLPERVPGEQLVKSLPEPQITRKGFPRRIPGAQLGEGVIRAQRVGINADGMIRARRAGVASVAAEVAALAEMGITRDTPQMPPHTPPDQGELPKSPLIPTGIRYSDLVDGVRAALRATGLIPTAPPITGILQQGMDARAKPQGKTTFWPGNVPVATPLDEIKPDTE